MYVKSSTVLRDDYHAIAQLCKETGEPVYLTEKGEGDLVVMDVYSFEKRKRVLEIEAELLSVRARKLNGTETYASVEEVSAHLDKIIANTEERNGNASV